MTERAFSPNTILLNYLVEVLRDYSRQQTVIDRLGKALEYALTVTFEAPTAFVRPIPRIHNLEHRLSGETLAAIFADYQAGLRGSALGQKYDLHESSIRGLLARHGIRPDNGVLGFALSPDEISRAVALYESGLSIKDVATELSRAPASIQKYLVQSGVELRPRPSSPWLRGTASPRSSWSCRARGSSRRRGRCQDDALWRTATGDPRSAQGAALPGQKEFG